jgi:pSer/pThr/pTyr-binding forkhead associated (FHA) protein
MGRSPESRDRTHRPLTGQAKASSAAGAPSRWREEITIGRDHTNALAINDRSVSRRHCAIRKLAAERFEIRDLGSRNGTAVNGLPVTARVLADGDEVRIGS